MTKLLQSNNEMTSAAVGFSWNIIFLGNFGFKIRLSKAFGFLGQKTYREKNIVCVCSSDIEFDDGVIIKLKVTGEDNIKKMIELSHSRGI